MRSATGVDGVREPEASGPDRREQAQLDWLAAAMTLALLLSAGAWALLPLVAVRALLGALAWRGSGRPLVEPARVGVIAFAFVLFGTLLVIALVTEANEGATPASGRSQPV